MKRSTDLYVQPRAGHHLLVFSLSCPPVIIQYVRAAGAQHGHSKMSSGLVKPTETTDFIISNLAVAHGIKNELQRAVVQSYGMDGTFSQHRYRCERFQGFLYCLCMEEDLIAKIRKICCLQHFPPS